jgi:SAM-dependent methyltransferase
VNISFDIISFYKPRSLEIYVKTLLKRQIIPASLEHQEFNVGLEPGENIIRFIVKDGSNRPCDVSKSIDSRLLGVGFQNFRVDGMECIENYIENEIDPLQLTKDLTIEELCTTADLRYRAIDDPTYLIGRPFSDLVAAPTYLFRLGLIFGGLYLGKTMSVLDFGAGSCWLSRCINQMQCTTISVDCSSTALEIGKRLFMNYPIIGDYISTPPQFLQFDGHNLRVESESVDRIICFDTFHHIPNQEEVLQEMYRVLKPGGLIGFSEPGREHSCSPESQMEMRYFKVLENNIYPEKIWQMAKGVGFSEMRIKSALDHDIGLEDYGKIIADNIPEKICRALSAQTRNGLVFFLIKGNFMPDSRCTFGLMHHLELIDFKPGNPARVIVKIDNIGQARWLHENIRDIGVVKLAAHLYDGNKLLKEGFYRKGLGRDVSPGETIRIDAEIPMNMPGRLALDLVSEQVTWFERVGAKPIYIDTNSTPQDADSVDDAKK